MGDQQQTGNTNPENTGNMIPKARFDEIYGKLKTLERAVEQVQQQFGAQSLEQLPQAIQTAVADQMGQAFMQVVQQTGTAQVMSQYFHQIGNPIPELDQMAAASSNGDNGMGGMDDLNDPYQQKLQGLTEKLTLVEQQLQHFKQRDQASTQAQLKNRMESAIKAVNPKISKIALDAAVEWMAYETANKIKSGEISGTPEQMLNALPVDKLANDYIGALRESFGIQGEDAQPAPGTQPTPGQNLPGAPQTPQAPPVIDGQGPATPDGDAAIEARKSELFHQFAESANAEPDTTSAAGAPAQAESSQAAT